LQHIRLGSLGVGRLCSQPHCKDGHINKHANRVLASRSQGNCMWQVLLQGDVAGAQL
jgi:hypothetical protein